MLAIISSQSRTSTAKWPDGIGSAVWVVWISALPIRNCSCRLLSSGPRSKNSAPSTFSYHSLVRSRLLIWILMCWINVTLDIASPPATSFVHRWPGIPSEMSTIIAERQSTPIESLRRLRSNDPVLLPLAYERGYSLSHHQHGRVDWSTHQGGHD